MKRKLALSFITILTNSLHGLTIDPQPIAKIYTPNSILDRKEQFKPLSVVDRLRYATCTSMVWLDDNHLTALNFFGAKFNTYYFDGENETFTQIQELGNRNGTRFSDPEHVALSPDKTLLMVANSKKSSVALYKHDPATHIINPKRVANLDTIGIIHNVRFSPDGNYIAFVSYHKKMAVNVYRIIKNGETIELEQTFVEKNNSPHLQPKAINFSANNKYIIIAYSLSLGGARKYPLENILYVRNFDSSNGTIGDIVSNISGHFHAEDLVLPPDNKNIILSDQANDSIIIYPFDPNTGIVSNDYTLLKGDELQLYCPHGLDISPDGTYLAIANYGDDSFCVYKAN